jgi:fluoride ion exporter CrcB/FEX
MGTPTTAWIEQRKDSNWFIRELSSAQIYNNFLKNAIQAFLVGSIILFIKILFMEEQYEKTGKLCVVGACGGFGSVLRLYQKGGRNNCCCPPP